MAPANPEELALHRRETVPEGVRRIAGARMEASLSELQGEGRARAVHDVRKHCKQLRALLRLVRSELGEEIYAEENARFRELARPLSQVRDAEVLIETLDALRRRQGQAAAGSFVRLHEALVAQRDALLASVQAPGGALDEATVQLQAARARLTRWDLLEPGWESVEPGLRRAYRRTRKAMERALDAPSDLNLHRWRKETKYLRAQLAALKPHWRGRITKLVGALERLGELLGEDHDLAVLRDAASTQFASALDPSEAELLQELIAQRRAVLQKKARRRGHAWLKEKPRRFVHALDARWNAWHQV